MAATNSMQYSVCIYEPNNVKKERINVGVLAYSYEKTFIATAWTKNITRLQHFDKNFNILDFIWLKDYIGGLGIPTVEILTNVPEEVEENGTENFSYLAKQSMSREQIMLTATGLINKTKGHFQFLPSEVVMLGDRSVWEAFLWVRKQQIGGDDD